MKILLFTILISSGFAYAEKYEMPSFDSQFDKPVSFEKKVGTFKKPEDWTSKYQVKDSTTVDKSKRLPSSKNSAVKFWDYKKKK